MQEFCSFECHLRRLLPEFPCFRDLDATCTQKVLKMIRIVSRKSDTVLFKQGGEADFCYILISGEVELRATGGQMPAGFDVQVREASSEVSRHCTALAAFATKTDVGKKKLGRSGSKTAPSKDFSTTLKAGALFGAVGTLGGEVPRVATAKCVSDCDLLEMKFSEFAIVMREIQIARVVRELRDPIQELLAELPWFQAWPSNVRSSLATLARVVSLQSGELVWRQGASSANQCYLIVSGHVQVWQKARMTSKGTPAPAQAAAASAPDGAEADVALESGTPQARQRCSDIVNKFFVCAERDLLRDVFGLDQSRQPGEQEQDLANVEHTHAEHGAQVAHLGVGKVFGEIHCEAYATTVTCSDRCCFLVFPRAEVLRVARSVERDAKVQQALPALVAPLLEKLPAVQKLKACVKTGLPAIVRYTAARNGSVLCWQGQQPSCCRILLSGTVAMWQRPGEPPCGKLMPDAPDTASCDSEVSVACGAVAAELNKLEVDQPTGSGAAAEDSAETNDAGVDDELDFGLGLRPKKLEVPDVLQAYGERVSGILKPGDVLLGDSILAEDADMRTAASKSFYTFVCEEDCQFASIQWSEFANLVKEEKRKEKFQQLAQRVAHLFKELPFFATLSPEVQQAVANISRYCCKHQGDVLFKEGDEPDKCYIIIKGEVTVFRLPENPFADCPVAPGERPPKVPVAQEAREKCLAFASKVGFLNLTDRSMFFGPTVTVAKAAAAFRRLSRTGDKQASQVLVSDEQRGTEADVPRPSTSPTKTRGRLSSSLRGRQSDLKTTMQSSGGTAIAEGARASLGYDSALGHPIACLGPGSIVGELGLVDDAPRSATVTCWEDSEFLAVGRDEFNRLLKQELKNASDEKLKFLLDFVPSFRALPEHIADRILYQFEKMAVPRNHKFLQQGEIHDGSFWIVWKGSVELLTKDVDQGLGVRKLGILLRGSVFGQQATSQLGFSAIAITSPCEVLVVKPDNVKLLPDVILNNLRQLSEQGVLRRKAFKTHFAPTASFSVGMGRPQSGTSMRKKGAGGFTLLPRLVQNPPFEGLFERPPPDMDFMEFELEPGETLALGAAKPRRRPQKAALRPSMSLPSMQHAKRAT